MTGALTKAATMARAFIAKCCIVRDDRNAPRKSIYDTIPSPSVTPRAEMHQKVSVSQGCKY